MVGARRDGLRGRRPASRISTVKTLTLRPRVSRASSTAYKSRKMNNHARRSRRGGTPATGQTFFERGVEVCARAASRRLAGRRDDAPLKIPCIVSIVTTIALMICISMRHVYCRCGTCKECKKVLRKSFNSGVRI